jgi:NitT/TauT family transport system substrate-binding protein
VSRLETEAGGKILVEETDSVTTVLVSGVKFLSRRDLARRFVAAHNELTAWIKAHPDEAQAIVRDELAAETRTDVKSALISRAWGRIVLTSEISRDVLERFVAKARGAGFLRSAPDLSRLIDKP